MAEAKPVKSGKKTTELYASVVGALFIGIAPLLGIEITPETQAAIIGGLVAMYTLGRSIVKAFS